MAGKTVIYSVDDNLSELSFSGTGQLSQSQHNAYLRYIQSADLALVYSRPMFEKLSELNKNVAKISPGIDISFLEGLEIGNTPGKIRIVYATSRHDRDILPAIFFPAMSRMLQEYGDRVEMTFWGYAPEEFRDVPNVRIRSYLPYGTFLREFYKEGFDIGLAPLFDDEFHRSKTNTKFRDYGICRVAGIYSMVDVYSDSVVDGETGILVDNVEEDWYRAIKRLIEDGALRESIKNNAEEYVKKHHNMERTALDLYGIIINETGRRKSSSRRTYDLKYIAALYDRLYIAVRFIKRLIFSKKPSVIL